jgi:hypothetical protein
VLLVSGLLYVFHDFRRGRKLTSSKGIRHRR